MTSSPERCSNTDPQTWQIGILTFVYPPFIALIFVPLAQIPFIAAYVTWACISLILYLAGLYFVTPRDNLSLYVPLALGFGPFAFATLMAGQISTIGFLAIASAIFLERRSQSFTAGIALSGCVYKPSLLLLIIPMLLITRRFRLFLGLLTGATILGAFSLALIGSTGINAFINAALQWSRMLSGRGDYVFKYAKNVDLLSFQHLTHAPIVLIGATAGLLMTATVYVWLRAPSDQVWAIALTATLVLNTYTPLYDGILLVIACVLIRPPCHWIAVFMVAGWVTQPMASLGYGQPISVIVAGFIMYQAWTVHTCDGRAGAPTMALP